MKIMTADILFPAHDGRQAVRIIKPSAVHVESGWELLTDTAVITLPRNVKDYDKSRIKEIFMPGRPCEIKLGYNGTNTAEFTGYIVKTSADIPIKIECQDEMWRLKQMPVNISTPSMLLGDFLAKIIPGYKIDAAEWQMPPQRHVRTTAAKVLEYLKSEYNLYSYFKGKTLVCGKIYDDDIGEPVKIVLELDGAKGDDLNYRDKDEMRIKIRAVSTLRTGEKLEAVVGDEDGTEQQLAYYGIEVQAELEKAARRDYEQMKKDGLEGGIKLFGTPYIRHGQKVALESILYPERNGIYYVDAVTVDWDESGGYTREIKLNKKAS